MNRKILQKAIMGLTDTPDHQIDISYVRGILETLLETLPIEPDLNRLYPPVGTKFPPYSYQKVDATNLADEGMVMDAEAAAKMASIKKMADDSITLG